MEAKILSAEVRRGVSGPDRVVLTTDGWGEFTVDVPRGGGPDYSAGVGMGSCKLVTSDGFEPKTETVELGPKSRPNDQTATIAFASAQVTEPVAGGPVTLVLDTRGGDGSNAGVYEHDFELAFPSLAEARAYLKAHGFARFRWVHMQPLTRGGLPRLGRKSGKPILGMLPSPESL